MSAIARYAEGKFFSSWRCDGSEQRLVDCNFLSGASQYRYRHGVRIQCQPGNQVILLISTTLHNNYDAFNSKLFTKDLKIKSKF